MVGFWSKRKMSDETPPPYSANGAVAAGEKEKRERREITLLHSELQGIHAGPECSMLLSPDTVLLRIWSGEALDGIECISADGNVQLLGHRTGSVLDHRLLAGTHITNVTVRSGAWMDAMQVTFSDGRSTPWCGGQGGGQSSWSGVIVGFVAQTTHGIIGKLGVITARDWREYEQFHRETQASGMAQAQQQQGPSQMPPAQPSAGRGKYTWDTGRLTRNRGVGVRWNHERGRVEIYQGSNDAHKYD